MAESNQEGALVMRILQVIDSVHPGQGGPVEYVIQMTSELREAGDHVEIVAFADPPSAPWLERVPCRVHGMGDARGRFAYSSKGSAWMQSNVDRFDAAVVNGIWRHSALATSRAARSRGVPYFIYPHGALDRALPGLFPVRHVRKKIYWEALGRSILGRAAGVCFTSAHEAARATAYRGPFRAVVTGSGIQRPPARNEEHIRALHERFPLLRRGRVILFMGRLEPIKGLDVLLRAFGKLGGSRDAVLLIAGQGSARYESPPGASVAWAGMLTGNDKWAAFHLADLFVLPSRQESFGVAAVEALATSTPVLVSDRVGIGDVISAYGAGAVFKLDEASIARTLDAWLVRPGDDASTNALRCYEENFLASSAAARLRAEIAAAAGLQPAPAGRATFQTR